MTLPEAKARAQAGEPFGELYRQLGTAWRPAFKEWWLRSATVPNRGVRNGKPKEGDDASSGVVR